MHFLQRFRERVDASVPIADLVGEFEASGILTPGRSEREYVLYLPRFARFILKRVGHKFIGITVLPPLGPTHPDALSPNSLLNLFRSTKDIVPGGMSNG